MQIVLKVAGAGAGSRIGNNFIILKAKYMHYITLLPIYCPYFFCFFARSLSLSAFLPSSTQFVSLPLLLCLSLCNSTFPPTLSLALEIPLIFTVLFLSYASPCVMYMDLVQMATAHCSSTINLSNKLT